MCGVDGWFQSSGWTFFQGQAADHVGLLSPKCSRRLGPLLDMRFTFVHDRTYLFYSDSFSVG
jgi:hypothetical protein